MFKTIYKYIKYLWKAKRRHGIHSPFMYDFGDNCLTHSISSSDWETFKTLKKTLLNSKEIILVKDLGAGSKKLDKERSVRKIAKISGSNDKYGKLLYRLVAHYQPKNILELGTSLGLGTFMLAAGNKNAKITTVEGCPNTGKIAIQHFPKTHLHQVNFQNSSFTDYLQNLQNEPLFDFVFIDGDHKSKSLKEQLRLLSPWIHDETLIVLDDIRWSEDMLNGWNNLVQNSEYHLTIDLFKMGIIAKRKHQQKEHFVIRY